MNRCRITRQFLRDIITGVKSKPKNRKVRLFIEKWAPTVHQGKLYHGNLRVVPYEDIDSVLKKEAEQNGMPLSRDGAFHYLKKKYVGFKKRQINTWLKRVEQLQLIHKRPHRETRVNTQNREGAKNYFMKNNKLNLGVDLFAMPKPQWSSYAFFFVAVLQRSGYTWIFPISSKKATATLTALKKVFRECKQLFGREPTGVSTDDGSEFKAEFDQWLKEKRIKRRVLTGRSTMTWWVEKKNSTFARIFAVMRNIHGFKKALQLTRDKVNNIQSRVTRKAPVDWTAKDFKESQKRYNRKMPQTAKRRKQPVFSAGDRVRYMLKAAQGKAKFYKSYEGMRSNKHAMWSKRVYEIAAKKKMGHGFMYKVNAIYRFPYELQRIEGTLVQLEPDKKPPAKKPKPQRKLPAASAAAPRMRRGFPPKRPAPVEAPVLRRSSRVRKKPVRFGYS